MNQGYQRSVCALRAYLEGLRTALGKQEAALLAVADPSARSELAERLYQHTFAEVGPALERHFEQFEQEASLLAAEHVAACAAFAREQLHPLLLCSPFVQRSFTKPLGYAGDYEMVNMILRESEAVPSGIYARLVDSGYLQVGAAAAHRNRIDMLVQRLREEVRRVCQEERTLTVLSVACGPASEVRRFAHAEPLADVADFTLWDFDRETLAYAEARVQRAIREAQRSMTARVALRSVEDIAQRGRGEPAPQRYDMIYCAGLFDYFSDQVCSELLGIFHAWLRPGGLLTVTNVHTCNPNRYNMEHILDWRLFLRSESDLARLAPAEASEQNGKTSRRLSTDPTGVNVFLDLRR